MSLTHVTWRCGCGVEYEGHVDSSVEPRVRGLWNRIHRGPGHQGEPRAAPAAHRLLMRFLVDGEFDQELVEAASRDPLARFLAAAADGIVGRMREGGPPSEQIGQGARLVEVLRPGPEVKPPKDG